MSSKQTTRKRVACNKCKRDKKKYDGSFSTQKPCKYCRDRNEYGEYTEPNRLRVNKIQSDVEDNEVVIGECEDLHQNVQTVICLCHEVMRNNNNHIITANREENNSTISDPLLENFNSWNPGTSGISSSSTIHATDIFPSGSTTPRKVESQQSNLIFSKNQLDVMDPSTVLNNQQTCDETVPSLRKNQNVEVIRENKKSNNSKKRKTRKNQRGSKRTQPYPAGGQIVIRPSKQAHTMIWHQNDPIEDVPIMAFHIQSPTPSIRPPPAPKPLQRTRPQPSFPHYHQPIPSMPIDIWDHSTTMTMLSPKPNFSESEFNETLPITNSILLSPTPSLHEDVADIISSPSNSSIDHNIRTISDDEKDHFGFISLTQSTGSPQSPSLFTMEDFIEMCSSNDLEPIWNC